MKKPLSSYFLAATKPERLTTVMGPMGNSLECGFAVQTGYVQRRTTESVQNNRGYSFLFILMFSTRLLFCIQHIQEKNLVWRMDVLNSLSETRSKCS